MGEKSRHGVDTSCSECYYDYQYGWLGCKVLDQEKMAKEKKISYLLHLRREAFSLSVCDRLWLAQELLGSIPSPGK